MVEGEVTVTVDGRIELIGVGASIHIPVGAIHRMENLGKNPMILIEVQTGTYLGEEMISLDMKIYIQGIKDSSRFVKIRAY